MADQDTEPIEAADGSASAEPERDWKAEYDKLREQSRKWESRSKQDAEKAKAYDELKAKSMTDAERAEEAAKRAEEAEEKLAEYERKAKAKELVAEVAEAKGVDAELLGRMAGDTREEVEANADFIAARLSSASIYPSVPDGGRPKVPPVTKEQIESIRDPRERVRMRAKHIDLYVGLPVKTTLPQNILKHLRFLHIVGLPVKTTLPQNAITESPPIPRVGLPVKTTLPQNQSSIDFA